MHQSSVPFIDCQGCANLGRPTRSLYWRLGSMAECQPVTSESHQNSSLVAGLEISSRQDNCPSCAGPVFISPGRRLCPRPRRRYRQSFDHGWSRHHRMQRCLPSSAATTPDYKIPVCRCSQDTRAELHYMSSRLLQCSVQWHHKQSVQAPTVSAERGSATCHRHSSTWPHHTSVEATPLDSGLTTSRVQAVPPGLQGAAQCNCVRTVASCNSTVTLC